MKDLMIDLETLGLKPSAPIIAIGAVFFDRNTGDLGEEFEIVIDFASACEERVVCGDTISWWMNQSQDAREMVTRGNVTTPVALNKLVKFFSSHGSDETRVWGNGATFDISMLENAFDQYGCDTPWRFWNIRDCRTVEDISGMNKHDFKRQGVHHGALDDAKHQAKYISAMIKALKE